MYPQNSYGYCSGKFYPCVAFFLPEFPSSQYLIRNLGLNFFQMCKKKYKNNNKRLQKV